MGGGGGEEMREHPWSTLAKDGKVLHHRGRRMGRGHGEARVRRKKGGIAACLLLVSDELCCGDGVGDMGSKGAVCVKGEEQQKRMG